MTLLDPPTSSTATQEPWHTAEASAAVERLGVDPGVGLTGGEAAERLARVGPNRLAEAPKRARWLQFLDQFRDTLILILIGAAIVSVVVSQELKTPIVVLIVVLLNAVLGFVQEGRAERSLDALKSMLVQRARVRRDGEVREVLTEEVVPGDIVLFEAGDRVPADGRLLVAANLEIEEAALTGESQPVAKGTAALPKADVPLGDRVNVAFMNTTVTRGRGEMLVTATGMQTELGRIAGLLREATVEKTPLQKQLDHLAHTLAAIAGVAVAIYFVIGLIRGESFGDMFIEAVALAVASIPEGLPAVVAVTLAIGTFQMAQQHAIVKRLASVETLGSTSDICSDKTGTLTLNQMTTRSLWAGGRRWSVSGQGYGVEGAVQVADDGDADVALDHLLAPFALCNDANVRDGQLVGDPTEGALVVVAAKGGIDVAALRAELPRLAEVPFDSATKFMATFHAHGDGVRLYVKGAPDVVLARSSSVLGATPEDVLAENDRIAAQGLRVLAVARRDVTVEELELSQDAADLVGDLTFLGLAGIVDPPRAEAKQAIAECRTAGIRVRMITGDHATTAAAIAQELGIEGRAVPGADLDGWDDDRLDRELDEVGVFARVAPEHKLRLVKALQRKGRVVAMTGDGVNDAPALRSADIGVAMGITGTEVTKEAATMVLTDDNFATIVRAVRQGRTIYDNIVKFVRFQLSTNIGAILTLMGAQVFGWAKPLTAIQVLWVNIIMDGPPAMALGVDPEGKGLMERPPRPSGARILTRGRIAVLAFFGLIMAVGTLSVLQLAPEDKAPTMAFTTFVLFQFFNILNARNETTTAFGLHTFRNSKLWMALGGVILLQVLAVQVSGLQGIFDTVSLGAVDWLVCAAVASTLLFADEVRKVVRRVVVKGA